MSGCNSFWQLMSDRIKNKNLHAKLGLSNCTNSHWCAPFLKQQLDKLLFFLISDSQEWNSVVVSGLLSYMLLQ